MWGSCPLYHLSTSATDLHHYVTIGNKVRKEAYKRIHMEVVCWCWLGQAENRDRGT